MHSALFRCAMDHANPKGIPGKISPSGCKWVLTAIADCAAKKTGWAWPKIPTLAKKTKMSKRAVQYAIGSLEADGLLFVNHSNGGLNRNNDFLVLPCERCKPCGVSEALDAIERSRSTKHNPA